MAAQLQRCCGHACCFFLPSRLTTVSLDIHSNDDSPSFSTVAQSDVATPVFIPRISTDAYQITPCTKRGLHGHTRLQLSTSDGSQCYYTSFDQKDRLFIFLEIPEQGHQGNYIHACFYTYVHNLDTSGVQFSWVKCTQVNVPNFGLQIL